MLDLADPASRRMRLPARPKTATKQRPFAYQSAVGYHYGVLCHGSQPRIQDPSRRTHVLKVRSDAKPDELGGRLENMVTGQQREFASGQEPAGITAANQAPPPRQKHSLLGTQRRARQYESIAPCRGGVSFRNPSSPTVARSSAVVSHRDEGDACVLDKLLARTGMRQLT